MLNILNLNRRLPYSKGFLYNSLQCPAKRFPSDAKVIPLKFLGILNDFLKALKGLLVMSCNALQKMNFLMDSKESPLRFHGDSKGFPCMPCNAMQCLAMPCKPCNALQYLAKGFLEMLKDSKDLFLKNSSRFIQKASLF